MNNEIVIKTPFKVKCVDDYSVDLTLGKEFSVGDNVVVNKISDDFVSDTDGNVKVGDIAIVTDVKNVGGFNIKLSNPNWKTSWWFCNTDISEIDNLLSHQEVIQAIIQGREIEIQNIDETWLTMLPTTTTLHQLIKLKFRLKPKLPLDNKRKEIIKKLLETKVAVLCKCWDCDESEAEILAVTSINKDADSLYIYNVYENTFQNSYAIDDDGNEITNI